MKKSVWLDVLIVLLFSVLCYLQTQWFVFMIGSDYGGLTAMFMGLILLWISFIVLYVKTGRAIKAWIGIALISVISALLNMKFNYLPATLMDYRLKTYYKDEYNADVITRGKEAYRGTVYLVYYLEDEPEYPFRAYAKPGDQNMDYEYHHAITAMLIDEFFEDKFDEMIGGDFKFSTDSLSIRIHENPKNIDINQYLENVSYIQMYCILETSLKEDSFPTRNSW